MQVAAQQRDDALLVGIELFPLGAGVFGHHLRIDRVAELEESAYIAGEGGAETDRRIVLPLLAPVLVTAALYIFSAAARTVATIVMLATGGNRPLALL